LPRSAAVTAASGTASSACRRAGNCARICWYFIVTSARFWSQSISSLIGGGRSRYAALRAAMGAAGRTFVVSQRGLAQAAAILDGHLHAALAQGSPQS
jgi:hypothetical protein